jgi:hypothetical protein
MRRLWLLASLFVACNTGVLVDPEGYRCDEVDPCPNGYTCMSLMCRRSMGVGGGDATAGGYATAGGSAGGDAGGSVGGGGPDGGDLCANVSCATVPSATCVGSIARSFVDPGRCDAATGQCVFEPFNLDCAPRACVSGSCPLTFSQTGPRLRFAVNAIDLAPGSTGNAVVAVGDRSQVSQWNGTRWSTVAAPVAGITLNAVHFTSQNLAFLVGENRTVWRFDRTTGSFMATVSPSGLSATANLVGVDGTDSAALVADTIGNWAKWNGTAWTSGSFPADAGTYSMRSVWVDETQRERVGGLCTTPFGTRRTCVAYRNPATSASWFADFDSGNSRSCQSLGPWFELPFSGGQDALCGFDDNDAVRHATGGVFLAGNLNLLVGDGIVGITGGPSSSGRRPAWVQTSSRLGQGRLYRLSGTSSSPVQSAQLDTFFGEEHLSPSESTGVVVAEVNRAKNVNNVFFRRTMPTERTDALDLGLDFVGATTFNGELALLSRKGDLAVRHAGSDAYEFRRAPSSPQYNLEAADGRNGLQTLLVVGRDGLNAGLVGRVNFAGYTRLPTSASNTTFKGVCRASEAEAWAVGTGGAVFSISATTATRDTTATTTNDLLAVDCPVVGQAVACGANSTVLRRAGGAWTAVSFPVSGRTLTSCKLVNETIWVAGDGIFARLGPQATSWTMLPALAGLGNLVVRAPNDVLATATSNPSTFDVVRFNGAGWTIVFPTVSGTPQGGIQMPGSVVWAGSAGTLVEGQ